MWAPLKVWVHTSKTIQYDFLDDGSGMWAHFKVGVHCNNTLIDKIFFF